jgi:hypothetical protein
MKLPISIAEKLILLQNGEKIPYSKIKHSIVNEMLGNGVLEQQIQRRNKKLIFLRLPDRLDNYLCNNGINNLQNYVDIKKQSDSNRAEAIIVSSNSKLKHVRTFKGFLVNCYTPIQAKANDKEIVINPIDGTFQFIYDFENFAIPQDITVVGIENPENFRYIEQQKYLFDNIKPLFVSRYPQNQNKDLIKWLQSIPNKYLHFGDFDFAGIGIYLNEYKKYLADRATFFIPQNIGKMFEIYGNKELYDNQKSISDSKIIEERPLNELISLIHNHRKGLEQEILIKNIK